jgi:hypothetical protein
LLIPLLYAILIGASCENERASNYFNRPVLKECITAIQDGATLGMMACDGKLVPIPSKMVVPQSNEDYKKASKYYSDREIGHYICYRFPRKCQKRRYRD